MSDFYQRQDRARRGTWWLILLFILCTGGIVLMVSAVASGIVWTQFQHEMREGRYGSLGLVLLVALGTSMLILGGTVYKVIALRMGGGTMVAQQMGGHRVVPGSPDLVHRRLLNTVEEMAIASGVPVPPVYIMEQEQGINAFAAGYSPSDAVLGVTRGCAEKLTREELQGVIAHEFSHILNGDMRLSIRLIGILHGIILISLIGRVLMYSSGGRYNRRRGNAQLAIVGLVMFILGWVGMFMGDLIRATISRQREYLADASAVQFTRAPSGIANALKKIGGVQYGSTVNNTHQNEISHMLFASGMSGASFAWTATHPPLKKRILAIEPNWDGRFLSVDRNQAVLERGNATAAAGQNAAPPIPGVSAGFAGSNPAATAPPNAVPTPPPVATPNAVPAAVVPAAALASTSNQENIPVAEIVDSQDIDEAWQHVGELDPQHQRYARQLIDEMDPAIVEAAREMFSARAIIFSLLLDQRADVRGHQIESIRSVCEKPLLTEAARLWRMMKQLPDAARLPLLDLTLPALRSMSKGQYTRFMQIIESLVRADKQVRLFEWMLFRVLQRHLSPQFQGVRSPVVKYYGLKRLAPQISVLLSAVAYASAEEEDLKAGRSQALIQQSISASAKNLAELVAGVQLRPADQCGLREIQASLETLSTAAPRLRGRVVDACAEAVLADGKVTVQEAELLRGIADLLDCPIPPII